MAVIPVCFKVPYKARLLPHENSVRQHEKSILCIRSAIPPGCVSTEARIRWKVLSPTADIVRKTNTRGPNTSKGAILNQGNSHFQKMAEPSSLPRVWGIRGENFGSTLYALKMSTNEKQLRLLDSYFGKLQGDASEPSLDCSDETIELVDKSREIDAMKELQSLNSYLDKLSKDANLKDYVSSTFDDQTMHGIPFGRPLSTEDSGRADEVKQRTFTKLRKTDYSSSSSSSQTCQKIDETSDLYLTSVLVSINIAVFLFELASPVRNSEFELFTLPLVYGAKINDLILMGEWWRLVTPMFLHSGALHVVLGCWSLLTFGPQVCRGYGSFTFLLIYILGGVSGNLTSFLHTPEPTVGGTGPIFAVIGAWLVYQMQNKDAVDKDVSESLFQKAIITTGLSFILSHFGPIDDWTHLGATITGMVYGFFTCPALQLDNASSGNRQDEGIALVRGYASPCKSLVLFAVFVVVLSTLLFVIQPPLDTLEPDDLDQFWRDAIM